MGDDPNIPSGQFNKVILDDLAPAIQKLRDVGVMIAGLFVGYNITHWRMRVTKNDLGDKTYEILDTIYNVNVIIGFPGTESPVVFGSQAQDLEGLLPIKMIPRFDQEFKTGDVIEVYRKDIYGNQFNEKYELLLEHELKTQSKLHFSFDLAPFRQDIKGEDKDILKPTPPEEEIMKVDDNDTVDDPIKDTDQETADDNVLLPERNRDDYDPFSEM